MNGKELYLRLLTYVKPYWKAFALALVCMGASALAEPAFPALLKYLLDDGFASQQGSYDFLIYPAALFAIFFVRAVIGFVADYLMQWVSQNVISELRQAMFGQMIRLSTQYFSDNASGRMMSRISYDVTGVAGASTNALTTVVKDGLAVAGLLGWLLWLNWKLTLITFITVPFIAFAVKKLSKRIRRFARGIQNAQGNITQILQEAIEGHKVIKIFGGQKYEQGRFNHAVREQRGLQMRAAVSNAALGPITHFFTALAVSVIMAIALYQASEGKATVGDFVSFITAMLMLLSPLRHLADVNAPLQRGLAAAESVFQLLDEADEVDEGKSGLAVVRGDLEFRDICFRYPGADKQVLQHVSLNIPAGKTVALVGQSGGGKSTLAALVPRFYNPDSGAVLLDGHDLQSLPMRDLRRNIAYVSQDVLLFNDTVAANIAYGDMSAAPMEAIEAAARAANALDFIQAMPEGFNTVIGENGNRLSGGQRQRLAIARAILKNAPILVLDEATSALDNESERVVQEALERLMTGRTTLVIAHRLSTVENADLIVVLANGKIVESGHHAELLGRNAAYSQLYRLQFSEAA